MAPGDTMIDEVEVVLASRAGQGLPDRLEDQGAAARVAALLDRAER